MLQVKSFKLTDDEGINELLLNYRLAAGASFFMSEGVICIPFEDGEPANAEQQIIDLKVQINEMLRQQEVLRHSNRVVEVLSEQMKEALQTAEADYKSAPNNKSFEARKKEIEAQILSNESQIRSNTYEINRLDMNIQMFGSDIEKLKG